MIKRRSTLENINGGNSEEKPPMYLTYGKKSYLDNGRGKKQKKFEKILNEKL